MPNIANYDEASIELCGNFAENFFSNFDTLKDQIKPSELFSNLDFDTLEKKNALDNYILKYYTKLDDNNPIDATIKKNMDKYLQTLYKRFTLNPTELIGSPFLTSPKIVDTYCPTKVQLKGKTVDLRSIVKETYMETTKDKKSLYIRDRNSNNLSKEETDILMHSLITTIGTDNKEIQGYQEAYLKKLISQKSKVSELSTKQVEFVAKYINNLMLTSRLKELGYSRNDIQGYIYIGEDRQKLGGFENKNSIYINKNSTLTKDIPGLIQVVCHETEHSIQELEASRNPDSKIGLDLAISTVLRNYFFLEKGYDVYGKNYRFEQIEQDAEYIGHSQAARYLDVLGFKDESKNLREIKHKKADSRQFEYDFRIDENGNKCTREEFFYTSLSNAISKQPYILNKYPSLLTLYTPDGKPKSFEELISGDFLVNDDGKCTIPEDFCKYYISKGALSTLDLSKFPEETQANIASRLITLLGTESNQIEKMGKQKQQYYYRDIDEVDKITVENFHLKNSRNIMAFINKNYQHFMDLQDKGKFSSIINMEYYDDNAKSFKFDRKYEGLAYNNPNNLETLKQLSIEAEENKNEYRANKKQKSTFTPTDLESSFNTLIEETRLGKVQQAKQIIIKTLPHENTLQTQQELEEKS